MKSKWLLVLTFGVWLNGLAFSVSAHSQTGSEDDSSKVICREITDGARGGCSANLEKISNNYVVKRGKVYWFTKRQYREHPCMVGAGAIFSNMTSMKCLRSERNVPEYFEERHLKKVAKYSTAFKTLEGSEPHRADWQQSQLADYAKDDKSVYFKGVKLEGADPKNFSVIFPFGAHERGKRYSLSQSGETLFFGWKPNPYIDFANLQIFTHVRCPGHGLSCQSTKVMAELEEFEESQGVFGWVGRDVIRLQANGVTYFPGVVSPDMFSFATRYRTYFYSGNKFYEVGKTQDKLIAMDVAFYERFRH